MSNVINDMITFMTLYQRDLVSVFWPTLYKPGLQYKPVPSSESRGDGGLNTMFSYKLGASIKELR